MVLAYVPATDTGVRDVSHPTISVAVVFEQTLHLVLFHARPNVTHDLTMCSTAHLVGVTEDGHFQGGLDHTTMWGVVTCTGAVRELVQISTKSCKLHNLRIWMK